VPPACTDLTDFRRRLTIPHLCKAETSADSLAGPCAHARLYTCPNARADQDSKLGARRAGGSSRTLVQVYRQLAAACVPRAFCSRNRHGAHARTRARGFPTNFLDQHATNSLPDLRSLPAHRPAATSPGGRRVRRTWPRSRAASASGSSASERGLRPGPGGRQLAPPPSVSTWRTGGDVAGRGGETFTPQLWQVAGEGAPTATVPIR
jgi:hypothetical protein